ncbi:MAG TPA: type II toxin-antitoxin system VapC family toxin [Candidatus Methylomirabilis sp.]|nr:type II toxin-antitoxin system VapC family toxin [Candidatus Methylomirabilis sp.]
MIVPDINLLVFTYNEAAPRHDAARVWWEGLMMGRERVAIPWAVILGFVRLVTHAAVLEQPLPPKAALERVRRWFAREHVLTLDPGPRHLAILEQLFEATGVGGNLTTDTHLAALAIEHQCELHSSDTDFARFPGLRWHNPLA